MELILVPLLAVLLVSGLSFVHTVIYDANKQAHNQDIEIKVLSLSSNREHIKYGVQANVFMWSPNIMTGTRLRKAWYSFGPIRVRLVQEMIGFIKVRGLVKGPGAWL